MIIEMPCFFAIKYPNKNRAYYSGGEKSKQMIFDLLKNASDGYCMYCGTSLNIEQMDASQIEHSVDKAGNKGQTKGKNGPLTNCKFNLAIACKDCNMKYKKQVKKVNLSGKFKKKCPSSCSKPCSDYEEVRRNYVLDNSIILQPAGVELESERLGVIYNPIRDIYSGNSDDTNNNIFIQQHIIRFHLNSEKRSRDVINICADIVELNEMGVDSVEKMLAFFSRKKQTNVIGKVFLSMLVNRFSARSIADLVEYCRTIVLCSAWI